MEGASTYKQTVEQSSVWWAGIPFSCGYGLLGAGSWSLPKVHEISNALISVTPWPLFKQISGACPGFNGRTCSATGINGAYTPAVLLPWLLLMFPLILDKNLERKLPQDLSNFDFLLKLWWQSLSEVDQVLCLYYNRLPCIQISIRLRSETSACFPPFWCLRITIKVTITYLSLA